MNNYRDTSHHLVTKFKNIEDYTDNDDMDGPMNPNLSIHQAYNLMGAKVTPMTVEESYVDMKRSEQQDDAYKRIAARLKLEGKVLVN